MAKFSYKAKNTEGKIITGELEAPDARFVSANLRNEGLFVIDIKASFSHAMLSSIDIPFKGKVTTSDITNFTRQISVMISSGLTISEALTSLRNQSSNPHTEKLLGDLLISVESGLSLSKSLALHKEVFPDIYIAVVAAGESSGLLDKMLNRLADNLEKEREFRGKLKTALIYPIIILIGVVIVVAILMLFVVPQMSSLYSQLNIELPLPTRIVVEVSNFFVTFWWLFAILIVVGYVGFVTWRKTPSGKEILDTLYLKVPAWGSLQEVAILAELTRTLSLLVGSGTPILDSLNSVSGATANKLYADAVKRVSKKVEKGLSLASAMAQEKILPPLLAQMARVGEETGKLDEVMIKISVFYEAEAERKIKGLTTVIEPVILVVLGFIVAFIMVSVISPIYNLTDHIV